MFPELKTAIVDSSAPHVFEPVYPAAIERYLPLDTYYDVASIKAHREQIINLTDTYHTCFTRAYRYLAASKNVIDDSKTLVITDTVADKIAKRTQGIISRELKKNQGRIGTVTVRFLDAITPSGRICRFDTVHTLCDRVYELSDNYGLADSMLDLLKKAAVSAGYDVIACLSPFRPPRLSHLLIPSLSLGFVTSDADLPYDGFSLSAHPPGCHSGH